MHFISELKLNPEIMNGVGNREQEQKKSCDKNALQEIQKLGIILQSLKVNKALETLLEMAKFRWIWLIVNKNNKQRKLEKLSALQTKK